MARLNINIRHMKFYCQNVHSCVTSKPVHCNILYNLDHSMFFSCKASSLYLKYINRSHINRLAFSHNLLPFYKNNRQQFDNHCYHSTLPKYISQVSVSHIKNVLTTKKIDFYDGFTSIILKCPFCNSTKKHELYINKVTGLVICLGCKCSGNWSELENILKENKNAPFEQQILKKYVSDTIDKWKELCKSLMPFVSLTNCEKKQVFEKLHLKEIPDNLIAHLNIHVNKNLSCLYVPLQYSNNSDIVGFKTIKLQESETTQNSDAGAVRLIERELTEPCHNCRGILLHKSRSFKKDKAVLVHSFEDFISLVGFNLNYNIICLPYGLTSLPQEILPILEKYKKIVFWFGNNPGCWDAAGQFAKKLSEERCYFVRPTKENPPAHIVLQHEDGGVTVKSIIEKAESIRHPSIINFSSIRQDVLSELQNIDKVQGIKWQRFPGLNNLVKGFRRGELTIFTGPTGCGKTTFLSEYSLDLLMQGASTLWGSFEVRNQRLARTMLQQYVQLPLDLHPDKLNYWADSFERLPLHFMTFHGQQPLKVVLEAVEHASYVYDIAHVIIDNVQFMLGMLDSETNLDRFYRQDALIAAFRNLATSNNCHVTLVIHPRKERDAEQLTVSSVFGGAKASQEADNVFIIQQKMLQSLKIKKYLQIAKNRFSGDLGLIPLEFDKETLCFSTKFDKRQSKKSDNNQETENISPDIPLINDLHVLQ
ncbi:mitochondrial DNA helicase [Lycorma delicatula]|uniref:mitochondrial DNA helicase n=1 Tax=Lycorma delicatula TaxID=130591 RepID=UPI003F5148B3